MPADASKNDILWAMAPLEGHCHRLSPSVFNVDHRGRPYPKWTQMENATEPFLARVISTEIIEKTSDANFRETSIWLGLWQQQILVATHQSLPSVVETIYHQSHKI